jgi:hypothetical protein
MITTDVTNEQVNSNKIKTLFFYKIDELTMNFVFPHKFECSQVLSAQYFINQQLQARPEPSTHFAGYSHAKIRIRTQ